MRTDIELIKDAIDIHLHTGPSVFPRLMDAIEAANSAKEAGMRGIVIKHHHTPTVDRSYLVHKAVPEVEVLGGVVLNYSAGGLNPFAVDAALKLGGKFIWMPSVDARNHARHFGEFGKYGTRLDYSIPRIYERVKGITILDEDENLKHEVGEILDIVSSHDAVIGTSHLDIAESKVLVEEAVKMDVKIVVTHVGFVTAALSFEDQKWMADKGAFLELCYSSLSPAWLCTTIEDVVENIVRVGPEHYILASDLGQIHNPSPVEGLRIYIMMLLERGLNSDQIRTMVKYNPERLFGLE